MGTNAQPIVKLAQVERVDTVIELHLSKRSQATRDAYVRDLRDFARWLGKKPADAVGMLLGAGAGHANELVLGYVAELQQRASAATVNRRLSALRSLVKLARTVGLVNWTLTVRGERNEGYRDTSGPGLDGVRAMLLKLALRNDPKGVRDTAIVRLLFDCGLRRNEVTSLDVADVDFESGCLWVTAKGKTAKVKMTLPKPTAEALRKWVEVRATLPVKDESVFCDLNWTRNEHSRMSGTAVYKLVRKLGNAVGHENVRPHGLRHAAITVALDKTNGDVRAVQRFSRHADPRTLLRYDDNRQDLGGEVAALVACAV